MQVKNTETSSPSSPSSSSLASCVDDESPEPVMSGTLNAGLISKQLSELLEGETDNQQLYHWTQSDRRHHQLQVLRLTQNAHTHPLRVLLLVLLVICVLLHVATAPMAYQMLTDQFLQEKYPQHSPQMWRILWTINWSLQIISLAVAIGGVIVQRVAWLAIALVALLFGLLSGSTQPGTSGSTDDQRVFSFSLFTLLLVAVLIVIYVARLRAFSEERLHLIGRPGSSFFAKTPSTPNSNGSSMEA